MSLTILDVGCGEDDLLLLTEVAKMETQAPFVHSLSNLAQAHAWAALHQPHIILVDIRMLDMDGVDFVRGLRENPACDDIPVLAIVDEFRRDDRALLLVAGATDIITAPLDPYESQARLHNLAELSVQRRQLRGIVRHADRAPAENHYVYEYDVLRALASAGDFSDMSIAARVQGLRRVSRAIARELSLTEAECDLIEAAAPMHDIGFVGIANSILQKPGPLTAVEHATMESHTLIGHGLLKDKRAAHLQCAADIALSHHERYDGTGYPHGIAGTEIPLSARIVAVADVYNAMGSPRPFRPPFASEEVLQYLQDQRGKQFDPHCVDALFAALGKREAL